MSYGTCKICGCTEDAACYHPEFGLCFWIDETHELCSHCVELKDDLDVIRKADFEKKRINNPNTKKT